jgi:hypothetical protein
MRTGGNPYGNQAGGPAFYRPAGNGKDIGSQKEDPFRMTFEKRAGKMPESA